MDIDLDNLTKPIPNPTSGAKDKLITENNLAPATTVSAESWLDIETNNSSEFNIMSPSSFSFLYPLVGSTLHFKSQHSSLNPSLKATYKVQFIHSVEHIQYLKDISVILPCHAASFSSFLAHALGIPALTAIESLPSCFKLQFFSKVPSQVL